jgi:hypothetical protein
MKYTIFLLLLSTSILSPASEPPKKVSASFTLFKVSIPDALKLFHTKPVDEQNKTLNDELLEKNVDLLFNLEKPTILLSAESKETVEHVKRLIQSKIDVAE